MIGAIPSERAEELPLDIGIKVRDIDGVKLRSFLASTPPMPGESLIAWVARIAALNAHRSLSKALIGKVGAQGRMLSTLASSSREAEKVAILLKANPKEVMERAFPVLPDAVPTSRISFFGVPVRACYRSIAVRRVSPLALRVSGHHRAIWELHPLVFDPATREVLLRQCPVCGRALGWRTTFGACYCDHCKDTNNRPTVDLRDFPQPSVEVDDVDALRFVASLVDPGRVEPALTGMRLPPGVREISRGELFDVTVILARVLQNDSLRSGKQRAKPFGLDPKFLAIAARTFIDWPKGFFRVADMLRDGMERRKEAFGLHRNWSGKNGTDLNVQIDVGIGLPSPKEFATLLSTKKVARLGRRLDAMMASGIQADMARKFHAIKKDECE